METFNRLVGVQDTYDTTDQPAQPASSEFNAPPPPPVPKDDIDETQSHSRRASRASLPLNRKPSHKSFRSAKAQLGSIPPTPTLDQTFQDARIPPPPPRKSVSEDRQQQQKTTQQTSNQHVNTATTTGGPASEVNDEDADSDLEWGPSHPCFPHPNPHCAPASLEASSTRVIRIRRDWLAAGDLHPSYANVYPEILDPLVTDSDFRLLISGLNSLCRSGFAPSTVRAWIDSLLGAFTGYIWEDLGFTQARKGEAQIERFIDRWNLEKGREGKEVRCVQLRRTGFMSLDLVIPDPEIQEE